MQVASPDRDAADVMLVTSLRDGMNLVAKERVLPPPRKDGALVLSEFTGAADELGIASWSTRTTSTGLKTAILRATQQSPPQARRRMRALRKQVHDHDVTHWADAFLTTLASIDP